MNERKGRKAVKSYYDIHLFSCTNQRAADHPRESCATRGGVDLQAHLKARVKTLETNLFIRANKAGCLDRCELGPVLVIYPEGTWYHVKTTSDVDEIIDRHVLGGAKVTRLLLAPDAQNPPR